MANKCEVSLVGAPEWIAALHEWSEDLLREFAQELAEERPLLQEDLRQAAPIAADAHHGHPPGTLRKGIRVTQERQGYGLALRARSTAPHAHLVERGTVKMAARPTFVPTVIRTRGKFNRRAKSILERPRPRVGEGSPVVVGSLGGGVGI